MNEKDPRANIDNFNLDIEIVLFRMNDAKSDAEASARFNVHHAFTRQAFLRIRRDLLELGIGDRKVIRDCDNPKLAIKKKDSWMSALNEIKQHSASEIRDMRLSRHTSHRVFYSA